MKHTLIKIPLAIIIFILILIIAILLFIFIGRIINKNKSSIKTTNGLQETVTIQVNGINEQLSIRGENPDNPVILFLHGGPGSPIGFLDFLWQPYLNDQFTVVTYDQRGCGITYYENPGAEVSGELILSDIDKTVDYLKERFHQDKIFIMGHSWGTILGTLYVQEHPEKVSGYIGIGQMVNMYTGEQIAFDETLKRATKANDTKYITKFTNAYEAFCATGKVDKNFVQYRGMETKYLLGEKEKSSVVQYLMALVSPDISLREIKWYLVDSPPMRIADDNPLLEFMYSFDANKMLEYEVPMYFISGGNDYVTPFSAVQSYYEKITAPNKDMKIMDGMGHTPFVDEPEEFAEIVKKLLAE